MWQIYLNYHQRMGILPLKKRVNRDKCSFTTKQRMFGVFTIDEILRYRGTRFPGSRTLCHPVVDSGFSALGKSLKIRLVAPSLVTPITIKRTGTGRPKNTKSHWAGSCGWWWWWWCAFVVWPQALCASCLMFAKSKLRHQSDILCPYPLMAKTLMNAS